MIENILKELVSDEDLKKARAIAERAREGKPIKPQQYDMLADEFLRVMNIIRDYAERRGPYAGL